MNLGTRRIRSAGRSSGSIELTLPPALQMLEGVNCRLMVRDGPRPEIILYPDLGEVQELFQTLWQKMRLGLSDIQELPDFSMADFTLALFPPRHWQERPPLAYADALAVINQRNQNPARLATSPSGRNGHLQSDEAMSRLLAFLAVNAGYQLGLGRSFALAFGDAVAYLVTGNPAGLGADFERGMAHRIFWGERAAGQFHASPFSKQVWLQARSGFRRIFDQFRYWQDHPAAHKDAQEKWYRALAAELQGQTG